MLKGINKRVIIIKNPESEIFEEAYFIVKNKSIFTQAKENDMVLEANRIISDYSRQQKVAVNKSGDNKIKSSKIGGEIISEEDIFDDDFFMQGHSDKISNLSKLAYPPSKSPAFRLVSSKKIKKFKLPVLKAPPRSFFIGVGLMSAIIIAARILEYILS